MNARIHFSAFLIQVLALLLFTGCNSSNSITTQNSNATYTVGGTVSGLSGGQLVLQNNVGDNLTVSSNGSFTFSTPMSAGDFFFVSVLSQPSDPAQTCIANDPGGSVSTSNATSVQVVCSAVPASPTPITSAANQWTWAGGYNVADQAGVYGQLGVPAVANVPGGRTGAVGWTDPQGSLWLFGGEGPAVGGFCGVNNALCLAGANEYFNDLWKFDGSEWTWMGGSNSANQPGVYGTLGQPDSSNVPGARTAALSWRDSQNIFWFFGGFGYDSAGNVGYLTDLWKYSGGQWNWMGGSKLINQPGVYGTQGKAAPSNVPGGRFGAATVADPSGNGWLFGGQGYDSKGDFGLLNDLWELSGGQWAWMSGSDNLSGQPGAYGTEGTPAAGNVPGSRDSAESWTDANGNLWLFSGENMTGIPGITAEFNDLWEYSAGEWTWVDGYNTGIQTGTFGTLGVPSPDTIPGARIGAVTWTDAKGNLWLFGGSGEGSAGVAGELGDLDDLWVYQPQ